MDGGSNSNPHQHRRSIEGHSYTTHCYIMMADMRINIYIYIYITCQRRYEQGPVKLQPPPCIFADDAIYADDVTTKGTDRRGRVKPIQWKGHRVNSLTEVSCHDV